MKTNSKQQDYHKYQWKRQEWLAAIMQSVGVVVLLGYFFYRSVFAVLPLSVVGYWYYRRLEARKREARIKELEEEFRECILSAAASLRAGYAVENAFAESITDMRVLYGENSLICQELEWVRRGLVINITLEELLTDLAERSGSGELEQFAEVFTIAKRSGGNLASVIQNTAELIGRHMEARQELQVLLSGRRMEQKVMQIMPFAIIFYIGTSYPGYFDGLYHNLQGILIMTACLLVYLFAYGMSERILQNIVE